MSKELRKAYAKWRGIYDERHERLLEKYDEVIMSRVKNYVGHRGKGIKIALKDKP